MTSCNQECEVTGKNVAKYVTLQEADDHLFCSELADFSSRNFLINLQHLCKIQVQRELKVERWDYISTFKPPAHLSIESG